MNFKEGLAVTFNKNVIERWLFALDNIQLTVLKRLDCPNAVPQTLYE